MAVSSVSERHELKLLRATMCTRFCGINASVTTSPHSRSGTCNLQSKAALQINFQKCTNNSVSSIVQYSSIMSFGSDVLLAVSHHTCLVKFTINRLLAASRHQASLANAIAFANLGEHSGGHSCPSSSATNRDSRPIYQNTAECIYIT